MSTHDSFWDLVDERLDARQDPLDDARIRDHLDAHPELLESFAQLTASLRAVTTTRQRKRRPVAIAGLALLAIGAWFAYPSGKEEPEPELVLPDLAMSAEVLRHASRTYTRGPDGELSLEREAGALAVTERAVLTHIEPRATTPHGHPIHTVLTKETHRLRPERITED